MPLPSSGPLSISAIRNELNPVHGSSYSLRQLSAWAGFGTPDSISEFYGYSAVTNLYIDFTPPYTALCWSMHTFGANTQFNISVNTNVTVNINWYGDLGGYFSGQVIIYSGTSCNVNYNVYSGGGVSCWGENISYASIGSISPSANGNQTFNPGNQLPFYNC